MPETSQPGCIRSAVGVGGKDTHDVRDILGLHRGCAARPVAGRLGTASVTRSHWFCVWTELALELSQVVSLRLGASAGTGAGDGAFQGAVC